MDSEEKLMSRAMAAYFRFGGIDQPSNSSSVEEISGKWYVILRNINGILSVYRVRNDDKLKRLKRWPKDIEE